MNCVLIKNLKDHRYRIYKCLINFGAYLQIKYNIDL